MSDFKSTQLRGLERVVARETNISDLLQFLTDLDPEPWRGLVGFAPVDIDREFSLTRVGSSRKLKGTADIVLVDDEGTKTLVELKLGHAFSDDQRMRYESSSEGQLLLAGLAGDEHLVRDSTRWTFMNLATIFGAWESSSDPAARGLAMQATGILKSWDEMIAGVFEISDSPRTLDSIHHKFLARVVSRQIVDRLMQLGWLGYAGVTSGGGLAIAQAWAPVGGDRDRCLIVEARWWEGMSGGELRIGVDYSLPESRAARVEAWGLTTSMSDAINVSALRGHLESSNTDLARLLTISGSGRPNSNCDWNEVVRRGFKSSNNPDGVEGNRRSIRPDFRGDGTQRFEALSPLDFTLATAADLVALMDLSLRYLVHHLPEGWAVS